jgi:hypothetical protein
MRNRKSKKDWPSREGQKKPKVSKVSFNEASKRIAVYEIGTPSWIKKEINTCTLKKKLVSTTISIINKINSYAQQEYETSTCSFHFLMKI